jgi:hypothetical protein
MIVAAAETGAGGVLDAVSAVGAGANGTVANGALHAATSAMPANQMIRLKVKGLPQSIASLRLRAFALKRRQF